MRVVCLLVEAKRREALLRGHDIPDGCCSVSGHNHAGSADEKRERGYNEYNQIQNPRNSAVFLIEFFFVVCPTIDSVFGVMSFSFYHRESAARR